MEIRMNRTDKSSLGTFSPTLMLVLLVCASTSCRSEVIVPDDAGTISRALSKAADGAVIFVKPGDYDEVVTFPRGGRTNITISAAPGTVTVRGIVARDADGLTVNGLNVSDNTTRTATIIASNRVTFRNMRIFSVAGTAVAFDDDTAPEDCVVENVVIENAGFGVIVFGKRHRIEDVEVRGLVRTLDLDADGFRAFGEGHVFRHCLFHGTNLRDIVPSHTDGFQTFGNGGRTLTGTRFEKCYFKDYHQGAILESNGGLGTEVTFSDCIFAGTFPQAGQFGILLKHEARAVIERCLIVDSKQGIFLRHASHAVVRNTLLNATGGIKTTDNSTVDELGNLSLFGDPKIVLLEPESTADLHNISALVQIPLGHEATGRGPQ